MIKKSFRLCCYVILACCASVSTYGEHTHGRFSVAAFNARLPEIKCYLLAIRYHAKNNSEDFTKMLNEIIPLIHQITAKIGTVKHGGFHLDHVISEWKEITDMLILDKQVSLDSINKRCEAARITSSNYLTALPKLKEILSQDYCDEGYGGVVNAVQALGDELQRVAEQLSNTDKAKQEL